MRTHERGFDKTAGQPFCTALAARRVRYMEVPNVSHPRQLLPALLYLLHPCSRLRQNKQPGSCRVLYFRLE
jgi:hypothetical protein